MAFFDKLSEMANLDKLSEMAKNVSDMANESLELNKLTSEINLAKGNIEAYKREIGEYYWARFAVGEKLDDEPMLTCDKIVVAQDKIRALEAEIAQIKAGREAEKAERKAEKEAEKAERKAERAAAKAERKAEKEAERAAAKAEAEAYAEDDLVEGTPEDLFVEVEEIPEEDVIVEDAEATVTEAEEKTEA